MSDVTKPILLDQTGLLMLQELTRIAAGGGYPSALAPTKWNVEVRAGSVTPAITLPTPGLTTSEEIVYIFTAATASAAFTAPAGFKIADDNGFNGLTTGNTLTKSGLTVGSIYECSLKVIGSDKITLVMKEWKTA